MGAQLSRTDGHQPVHGSEQPFYLDHIGGNEAYRDDIIIASKRTLDTLIERKEAIETGKMWGPPAIQPLVLPNAVFERRMDVMIGDVKVELHNVNIHTPDSVVAYIPADKILLAGDTIEDSVVFISTPTNVVEQIGNLATLRIRRSPGYIPITETSPCSARAATTRD